MRISTAAAIALAEEIKRRAAGPDHMAFDAVTWRDLGPDSGGHGADRQAGPTPGGADRVLPPRLVAPVGRPPSPVARPVHAPTRRMIGSPTPAGTRSPASSTVPKPPELPIIDIATTSYGLDRRERPLSFIVYPPEQWSRQ